MCPVGSKNFAKRCSFSSDNACRGVFFGEATEKTEALAKRACPGIALAKMGRPNEKSLLGNAPGISQLETFEFLTFFKLEHNKNSMLQASIVQNWQLFKGLNLSV